MQSCDDELAKAGIIMKSSQQTTVILNWDHSGIMAKEGSIEGVDKETGSRAGGMVILNLAGTRKP